MSEVKSGFRRLLELTDKSAREELNSYYIISESRMDNYLNCLEDGAKQIAELRAQLSEAQGEIADLKNELNRCDCGACDWCNGTTYYHMKRKLYQKDKDCQKAEAANADLQRKLNVAVRLEADSDATFDWNVLGKIDDLERENADLRNRLQPVEYQNHEFCKDVECTALEYNSCNAYVCHKTAKHFHRWLDQNGYTISKAIKAACEGNK